MFDDDAPIWKFIEGIRPYSLDPFRRPNGTDVVWVCEVFPAMAALGLYEHHCRAGMLKYNPRRRTFKEEDWRLLASALGATFRELGIEELEQWAVQIAGIKPTKALQDQIDAAICLLVGLLRHCDSSALYVVGDTRDGYILTPTGVDLLEELKNDALTESVSIRPCQ